MKGFEKLMRRVVALEENHKLRDPDNRPPVLMTDEELVAKITPALEAWASEDIAVCAIVEQEKTTNPHDWVVGSLKKLRAAGLIDKNGPTHRSDPIRESV
jgi:hypothetical protein